MKVLLSIYNGIKKGINFFFIGLVKFYKKFLSPLKLHHRCKYIPSCSQFALEALQKYGPFKGMRLAIWRILRCNPFSKGGFDPVP